VFTCLKGSSGRPLQFCRCKAWGSPCLFALTQSWAEIRQGWQTREVARAGALGVRCVAAALRQRPLLPASNA
jgi:hypothetical protein